MASLFVDLVGLPLRFIGFGSFLCHTHSFPLARANCQPCGFQGEEGKNPNSVALGRLGGLKGKKAARHELLN
jgi:hypothetical protein